jgi:uncharacterized membrane protein
MFRAEARGFILSSMAHQWLINRSLMDHQSLINRSSIAHILFLRIFSFGTSSLGSSTLFQSLLGLSSVRCVVLLLLHSTVHRLTAAKLGTRRLRGGSGFGNRLGRTSRNACNVMSTCCEKCWLPSNRSS